MKQNKKTEKSANSFSFINSSATVIKEKNEVFLESYKLQVTSHSYLPTSYLVLCSFSFVLSFDLS